MRKFALLPLFVGFVGFQFAQAQVRDLFAEFEQEATTAPASSVSSATVSSAAVAPVSNAAIPASSASKAPVSSAAVAPASSAAVTSSSSVTAPADRGPVAQVDSAKIDTAKVDSVKDAAVTPMSSSSSVPVSSSAIVLADSVVVDSAKVDSIPASSSAQADSAVAVSSSSAPEVSSSSESPVNLSSSSMSRRDLLGPVKVSRVHGIDEMKGQYKSPKKALFMSLVIPGSGQLYTGGSTFTTVRGAVYLALEAALWGNWYYFSVYKYDRQVNRYKKFAKKNYSIGRYEKGMRALVGVLADETEESRFENRYMGSRKDFCEALYGKASTAGCYVDGKLFSNDKAHQSKFSVNDHSPKSLEQEMKDFGSFYDGSAVYQQIADRSYVLGWNDVTDPAVAINLELETDDPEGGIVPLGSSANMKKYRDMRNKANDYADMQAWFFGGIILNHLVSAVDAALTAHSHNKSLYSEDLTWFDRMHFDSYFSLIDGLDVGVQASWGF